MRSMTTILVAALAILPAALPAQTGPAQIGPDIIVGVLHELNSYGTSGSTAAFSIGTRSCNVGDVAALWNANTIDHPVIGQNMFRLHDGRFEQIGMSWLKHGIFALSGNDCSSNCIPDFSGMSLGPGCSDPYSASLNGVQGGLGPRSEVNPHTGAFPFPFGGGAIAPTIGRRIQVHIDDLDPAMNPGALYYGEAQYVSADDAAAGNGTNNNGWRPIDVTQTTPTTYQIALNSSGTRREQAAIFAWQEADPDVVIQTVDAPNDGRLYIAFKQTDLGGGMFRYEYAVQNITCDRALRAISFALPSTATVSNFYFHDVDSHSGEPFSNTDWTPSFAAGQVRFETDDFNTNQNANALRWGSLYNFGFVANDFPNQTALEFFKPGAPATMTVPSPLPPFVMDFPNGTPANIVPNQPFTVNVTSTNLWGAPDNATGQLFVSTDDSPFASFPMTHQGGNTFEASLPASPWFARLRWYVSLDATTGDTVNAPFEAPGELNVTVADVGETGLLVDDNFETNMGWTTAAISAFSGGWTRGDSRRLRPR